MYLEIHFVNFAKFHYLLSLFLAIDATINCIDFGHIMVLACSFSNHFYPDLPVLFKQH